MAGAERNSAQRVLSGEIKPMLFGSSPPTDDWTVGMFKRRIAECQKLATNNRNPLYIWEALSWSTWAGWPPPEWTLDYLGEVSLILRDLAWSCSKNPDFPEKSSVPEGISANEALKRVAWALQVSRQGWNAFDDVKRTAEHIEDARCKEAERARPKASSKDPMPKRPSSDEAIRIRRNVSGKRSVQRRVKKGLDVLK